MTGIHFELARAHPFPFMWPDAPVAQRIPVSRVAGRISDAGYHHNAFSNIFNGHRIPPNRLQVVNIRQADPTAVQTLMKEVLTFNTAVLHVFNHEKYGFPALLSIASLLGTVVVVEIYQPEPLVTRPLELLRKHHPDLHRVFVDPQILRLTTSYEDTSSLLAKQASPNLCRELVDLVLVASLVRQRDFVSLLDAPDANEHLGLQVMVWSFLGTQFGPTPSKSQWLKDSAGSGVDWEEERRHLYRFRKGHPLNTAQLRWIYQIARAGGAAGLHGSYQTLSETEMDLSEDQTRNVIQSTLKRLRSRSQLKQRGWWAYVVAHRADKAAKINATKPPPKATSYDRSTASPQPSTSRAGPPSVGSASSDSNNNASGSLRKAKADMYKRNAPLQRASPKKKKDYRRETGAKSPRRHREQRHPARARLREDHDAEKRDARRSRSPPRRRSPSRPRSPVPSREPEERRQRRSAPYEEPIHRGRGHRYQQYLELDRAIRRQRQQRERNAPNALNAMGPQFCQSCAHSPPHLRPEDCPVMKYATGKMPSKRGLLPCVICSSKRHTSRACPHIQQRCSKCHFGGHSAEECDERTPEEWLIHYLLHVHQGRLTRSNPLGPLQGEYGFGDISQLRITDLIRRLIQEKQQSLITLQAAYPDEPEPEEELHAAWMMLIREQEAHRVQVDEDNERLQNDLVRRVAEALRRNRDTHRATHSATTTSKSTESTWVKTEIIVSPATPTGAGTEAPELDQDSNSVASGEESDLLREEAMDTTSVEPGSSSSTT